MEHHFVWLIAAFSLVIIELITGTFYLLVLGFAGFAGAAVAALGLPFAWQALIAAIVALAGVVWVHHWRVRRPAGAAFSLDAGQPTIFESWINRDTGHARVKYRDTQWDAIIDPARQASADDRLDDIQPGEVFYVVSINGNTLKVSRVRPA